MPFAAGEDMADDLRNMVWRGTVLHYGPADVMLHVPVDKAFMANNEQALVFAPYYRESLVLVHGREDLRIEPSVENLRGIPVAAEYGTAAAEALLGASHGALRDQVRITASGAQAMALLLSGTVKASLVTRAQAEGALVAARRDAYVLAPLTLPGLPQRRLGSRHGGQGG